METRAAQIRRVIDLRAPLGVRIKQIEASLLALHSHLSSFTTVCDEIFQKLDSNSQNEIKNFQISIQEILGKIASQEASLIQLRARFERKTLNIGVVGRARQGKSRLLQAISGLTTNEIPDGSGSHCTGVRSTIRHDPSGVRAEVLFHTEQSFLSDVIHPYFDQLKLGSRPLSFSQFAQSPLPTLPLDVTKEARIEAMYEHLKNYHQHSGEYGKWLKAASPKHILREEIREFIAQDDVEGKRCFFNFLAVKEVIIHCPFQNADVGEITLIDMPGLGDTGVGDQERMIKTLGRDVDLVLFVRMPKYNGDFWADVDVKLYDIANSALREDLPIDFWSYMILNRVPGKTPEADNLKNCELMQKDIGGKHIRVIECLVTNCAQSENVNEVVMERALKYLSENIVSLDEQYAKKKHDKLIELIQQVNALLASASVLLKKAPGHLNWHELFVRKFREIEKKFYKGIADCGKGFRAERDFENQVYKNSVKQIIQELKTKRLTPTIDEIEQTEAELNGLKPSYYAHLNFIRAKISKAFLTLDQSLNGIISSARKKIGETLGVLGGWEFVFGYSDERLLINLENLLAKDPKNFEQLHFGFRVLNQFELSYRGLIHHRIRKCLDPLDPDSASCYELAKETSASEVEEQISTVYDQVLYQIEDELEKFSVEVNMAVFGMVEEFIDRVLRPEDIDLEWRVLYEPYRSEIWKNEFGALEENSRIRILWENGLKTLEDFSKPDLFAL